MAGAVVFVDYLVTGIQNQLELHLIWSSWSLSAQVAFTSVIQIRSNALSTRVPEQLIRRTSIKKDA